MPRGGARPGAGRPKKAPAAEDAKKRAPRKPAAVPAVDAEGFKTDPSWPFGQQRPPDPPPPEDLSKLQPLDYLLSVMRDPEEDKGRRMQAATLAAPYVHPKKGESTKKAEAEEKSKAASSGRFGRRQPPAAAVPGKPMLQ